MQVLFWEAASATKDIAGQMEALASLAMLASIRTLQALASAQLVP
jgi:hypothetical protein